MKELPALVPKGRGTGAAIIERCTRRDQVTSCHIHSHEDEIIYVLAGRILVQIGETRRSYGPGECLFLPCGDEHAIGAESDEARLLTIALPAGIEEYYRELDGATAASEDELERQIALAARAIASSWATVSSRAIKQASAGGAILWAADWPHHRRRRPDGA